MFLNNESINLFIEFLWVGLLFGVVSLIFRTIVAIFKKNIVAVNVCCFCFWLAFGVAFALICFYGYNYSFCWFGLLAMLGGLIFVKTSFQFFFDYFGRFIYNKFILRKGKRNNGELQTDKKV